MKRGPKPKPTSAKILQGTFRADRHGNPHEPQPEKMLLPCPAHLDAEARREWNHLAPLLFEAGLLTELDGAVLEIYCVAYSRHKQALAKIRAEGEVLTTPAGYKQKNPWLTIARDAVRDMNAAAAHFGLSPSTRVRVRATPPDTKSPLAKFLRRGHTPPDQES